MLVEKGSYIWGLVLPPGAHSPLTHLPAWVLLPLMMLLGMLGGDLWAFIPGYSEIPWAWSMKQSQPCLLNSVAPSIVAFFVFGFWHSPMDTNKTPNFVDAARLPTFFDSRIDLSFFIAIVLLLIFWYRDEISRVGTWKCEQLEEIHKQPNEMVCRSISIGSWCMCDRRCNCRVGRCVTGFRVLRCPAGQFFARVGVYGVFDLLVVLW